MSRLRLLKILYIADREALKEIGRPISSDTWVAMKNGPVLSRSYNVIKGEDVGSTEFNQYVDQQGHLLFLVKEPGKDQLNRFEIRKLHELSTRYRELDDWDIVEETHQFKEWIKNNPGESSRPIPLKDVLAAVDMPPERIEIVLRDAENVKSLERVLHQAAPMQGSSTASPGEKLSRSSESTSCSEDAIAFPL
jgi:uncharacterized phage-associated protein